MSTPLHIGVCGTTQHTRACIEAMAQDDRLVIDWVVTPPPKPIGRRQELTANPVEQWAREHNAPVFPAAPKLAGLQEKLAPLHPVDFLFVVDFGYLIPAWLLALPRIAPVNVHPSDLPKYRGSAPGQYTLLFGEHEAAVCIMLMDETFDTGALLKRIPFVVDDRENQLSYYEKAFSLVAPELADTLATYSQSRQSTPQPPESPTPLAGRFEREDGFVPFALLTDALHGTTQSAYEHLPPLFSELLTAQHLSPAELVDRAVRALTPWPGVWTIVQEKKGQTDVRLKILDANIAGNRLTIATYQFAGEPPRSDQGLTFPSTHNAGV